MLHGGSASGFKHCGPDRVRRVTRLLVDCDAQVVDEPQAVAVAHCTGGLEPTHTRHCPRDLHNRNQFSDEVAQQ